MSGAVVEITRTKGKDEGTETVARAVYEHPLLVRLCHWANAISLFVMVGSGLQIFRAFPSFGAKIPQKDLLNWPKSFAIGGWLGGALHICMETILTRGRVQSGPPSCQPPYLRSGASFKTHAPNIDSGGRT